MIAGFLIGFFIGGFIGGAVGVITMALAAANGRRDHESDAR